MYSIHAISMATRSRLHVLLWRVCVLHACIDRLQQEILKGKYESTSGIPVDCRHSRVKYLPKPPSPGAPGWRDLDGKHTHFLFIKSRDRGMVSVSIPPHSCCCVFFFCVHAYAHVFECGRSYTIADAHRVSSKKGKKVCLESGFFDSRLLRNSF